MRPTPPLSAALCALLFVGLSLVQAFLSRRATRATRTAIKELRAAMKESFQRHHASLEILAKMIRAQPGERFSIELPHAPEFMIAPASAALAPAIPAVLAPRAPRDALSAPSSPASSGETPESQRPTRALVTAEASRPTPGLPIARATGQAR